MNVVLITVDCLRADHLSCVGYRKNTSPFIDAIASRGLLFKNAIVNGAGTFASFTSLMTSTYPFTKGTFERINRKTLAEVLSERGYLTAGINDNGFLSPYFGFDRGFNYFNCIGVQRKKNKIDRFRDILSNAIQATFGGDIGMNGKLVTKLATDWINKNKDENFFLWIHYMDVHGPHYAPRKYYKVIGEKPISYLKQVRLNEKLKGNPAEHYKSGKISRKDISALIATYDAEIRYVDDCIRYIFTVLDKNNLKDKTYIFITGDHGEEFFEHGNYHSNLNLYDEMIRIPLIIYGPHLDKRVITNQVRQIDFAPTVLDVLEERKEPKFMGKSLLRDNCTSKYIITEAAHYTIEKDENKSKIIRIDFNLRKTAIRAQINGEVWKYIYCTKTKKEELYNVSIDQHETVNLAKDVKYDSIKKRLRKVLMEHISLERVNFRIKKTIRNKEINKLIL